MAPTIFARDYDDVTNEQRGQAKTINFATLYGQGPFSLATQLSVSREQAQGFIDEYFERFGEPTHLASLADHRCLTGTLKSWRFQVDGKVKR